MNTSLALAAHAATLAACGGGGSGAADSATSCGPADAPEVGLLASSDAATLTYGQLHGGLNRDCPAAGAPDGVISMTISGTQAGADGLVTLCVTRPDLLASQPQALGLNVAGAEVRLVDLRGTANSCSFAIDDSQPVTGTATSAGLCGNGRDPAGFALVVDGALSLIRTCGATIDSVRITLHGRVAVTTK